MDNDKISDLVRKYHIKCIDRKNDYSKILHTLIKELSEICESGDYFIYESKYDSLLKIYKFNMIEAKNMDLRTNIDSFLQSVQEKKKIIISNSESSYPKIKNILGVPLLDMDKCMGVLILCNKQTDYKKEVVKPLFLVGKLIIYILNLIKNNKDNLELRRTLLKEIQTRKVLELQKDDTVEDNKRKSMFLATMSHELKTPINGISGLSELLASDKTLTSEQIKMINEIRLNTISLLSTINDILDYSKLESNDIVIESKPFSILERIEEIKTVTAPLIKDKKLELTIRYDPDLPKIVLGDSKKYGQIISGLLSNAIKFTELGNICLAVSGRKERLTYIITTSIRDTGIGIKKIDELFKPFTQIDASLSRKYGGSGLGLSICQLLCKNMGGHIWASSSGERGKGSTFSFTILVYLIPSDNNASFNSYNSSRSESDNELKTQESPKRYPSKIRSMLKKTLIKNIDNSLEKENIQNIHVLVVDDILTNQLVITKMLKKLDITYETALNGREAVDLVKKNQYNLILMDIQMPEMDGHKATKKIRKFNTNIPIVAVTAHASQEDKDKAFSMGMNDYMSKPISVSTLTSILIKNTTPIRTMTY